MTVQRRMYDETLRRYVVKEIEDGALSQAEAAKRYGMSKALVKRWLEEYGTYRPKREVVEVVMKSEEDKIRELEKALSEAHLKIRAYEELLKIAEKTYGGDVKKTLAPSRPVTWERRLDSQSGLPSARDDARRLLQATKAAAEKAREHGSGVETG